MKTINSSLYVNKMMEEPSNDSFCSLDMLAEVASATLQNDPSIISGYLQRSKSNIKLGGSSRKSTNSSDKLSLDQIKCLSDKNLIEMFSEHVCDEMKRNYSFQCYLIPEKCTQVFKSFGNETQACIKMKAHLLNHIKDLVAAAHATNSPDVFMAEPLHVQRKRLKEANRKNTRKKKQSKQLCNKSSKDISSEHFSNNLESIEYFRNKVPAKVGRHGNLHSTSDTNCDGWVSGFKNCLNDDIGMELISDTHNHFNHSSSNHETGVVDANKVLLKNWPLKNELYSPPECYQKKKQKSKVFVYSKSKLPGPFPSSSYHESNSNHKSASQFICDASLEAEFCLPIYHDHTYTSVSDKTFNCDPMSSGESCKPTNKVYKDPLFSKQRTLHHCFKKESPLIIPTPAFPYVYNPILPHIAHIQEVGIKTTGCKRKNIDFVDGLRDFCSKPNVMHHSSVPENDFSRNPVCHTIKNPKKDDNLSNVMNSVSKKEENTHTVCISKLKHSSFKC